MDWTLQNWRGRGLCRSATLPCLFTFRRREDLPDLEHILHYNYVVDRENRCGFRLCRVCWYYPWTGHHSSLRQVSVKVTCLGKPVSMTLENWDTGPLPLPAATTLQLWWYLIMCKCLQIFVK